MTFAQQQKWKAFDGLLEYLLEENWQPTNQDLHNILQHGYTGTGALVGYLNRLDNFAVDVNQPNQLVHTICSNDDVEGFKWITSIDNADPLLCTANELDNWAHTSVRCNALKILEAVASVSTDGPSASWLKAFDKSNVCN